MPAMLTRRRLYPLLAFLVLLTSIAVVLVDSYAPARAEPLLGDAIPAVVLAEPAPAQETLQYIVVQGGCDYRYQGECVRARSGPGTGYPVVTQLRDGIVLRVADTVEGEGRTWYRIGFDEWLRYPNRASKMYVAADLVTLFTDPGPSMLGTTTPETARRIVIDRGAQTLDAYDGDVPFMHVKVSTGLDLTPTPRGSFVVYAKTPSRYMQGPLPGISDQYYDLPGVPWDLYFTKEGGAIHGAYWHDSFGRPWSHGCVNLSYDDAKKLYEWAPLGTTVTVRD